MYPFLFRTVLTRTDPETAHHAAMIVIRALGLPGVRELTRRFAAPSPVLRTRALGLDFESPFGVAAGFDKNVTGAAGLHSLGFGHVELQSACLRLKRHDLQPQEMSGIPKKTPAD